MTRGLLYAENRKICKTVKVDPRKVFQKNDYSKGHLRTRLKGVIDMIRNHFSPYLKTQVVLISYKSEFLSNEILKRKRKYQTDCKKE